MPWKTRSASRSAASSYAARSTSVAVRARDGLLALTTMLFADEVRATKGIDNGGRKPSKRALDEAVKLIEALSQDFDPTDYADEHRERLLAVIEDKKKKRTIEAPEQDDEPPAPTDLMAALRKTMEQLGPSAASADIGDCRCARPVTSGPMRALTFHGKRDVRIDTVPDPTIEHPTDAVIRVTSSGLCGSDLHLYEVLGPFTGEGDVLGHEPMGIVEAVGADVTDIAVGDRVVIPFNISCGHCFMCDHGLQSQCETTQVRDQGMGAALFGYTKLYGEVPGGQAEYLRVPQAQYGPIKVPEGPPDDRFLFLSDVLPTAWQAVQYAQIPEGGSVAVIGLGPIGEMSARIAQHQGAGQVIGLDLVPERLARSQAHGVHTIDVTAVGDVPAAVRELTGGRGPGFVVIDAVGIEGPGAPGGKLAHTIAGLMPDTVARKVMEHAGIDRLSVLNMAVEIVRRGGTISLSGVYGGTADPLNMLQIFDKQLTLKMGQANVKHWIDDILPLLSVTTTRSASTASRPTTSRSARHPRPTRCSRRRRTARSRWCSSRSVRVAEQHPQVHHRLGVDLADARLGDVEDLGDLGEGQILVVAQRQDRLLAPAQLQDRRGDLVGEVGPIGGVGRIAGRGVGQEVEHRGRRRVRAVEAPRLVEGDHLGSGHALQQRMEPSGVSFSAAASSASVGSRCRRTRRSALVRSTTRASSRTARGPSPSSAWRR